MNTLLDVMTPEELADGEKVERYLSRAYADVFGGNPTQEQRDIVLVDMAHVVRYYDTTLITVPADEVKAIEQSRHTFRRILEALAYAGREPAGLHTAVLRSRHLYAEENQE